MTTLVLDRSRAAETGADVTAFVSLRIAEQLCGIAALGVRDILAQQVITRIPLAPSEIAGSLNLRGRIVTTINLRQRLRLPPAPPGAPHMSVVTERGGELYALMVDQVCEVLSLPADQFEPNPATLPPSWAEFSLGIYRLKTELLVVLDADRLLALGNGAGSA